MADFAIMLLSLVFGFFVIGLVVRSVFDAIGI